jgi:hypothetical protein
MSGMFYYNFKAYLESEKVIMQINYENTFDSNTKRKLKASDSAE